MFNQFALFLVFFLSQQLSAQEVVQEIEGFGRIDWTKQVIFATGVGIPDSSLPQNVQKTSAIESAKKQALLNMMEIIKNITITSEETVQNLLNNNSFLEKKIEGITRNFRVKDIRHLSTGDTEVDVSYPIYGPLSDLFLPKSFGNGILMKISQPLCPCCGQPWPEGKPVPESINLIMPNVDIELDEEQKYTGLIIDARGLQLNPALSPKLLNENNNEIYGQSFNNRNYAVDIGVVGYINDISIAEQNNRVIDNPIVIKAKEACGTNNTDIIISNSDGLLIHAVASNFNFLERCRVIFVVD